MVAVRGDASMAKMRMVVKEHFWWLVKVVQGIGGEKDNPEKKSVMSTSDCGFPIGGVDIILTVVVDIFWETMVAGI